MDKTPIEMKRVRFSNIVIVYDVGSSEEHRAARNGLQDLRERQRFRKRIKNVELILSNVLKSKITQMFFYLLPYNQCTSSLEIKQHDMYSILFISNLLIILLHDKFIQSVEWCSWKHTGLITQRSMDQNHAPPFILPP